MNDIRKHIDLVESVLNEKKVKYKLTPQKPNSVIEYNYFENESKFIEDYIYIDHTVIWKKSSVILLQKPDLSNYNPAEGIDILGLPYENYENWSSPGNAVVKEKWGFDPNMSDEEIQVVKKTYKQDGYAGLEDSGWTQDPDQSKIIFKGPLKLEQI